MSMRPHVWILVAALALTPARAQAPAAQCVNIVITGDGWLEEMRPEFEAACAKVEEGVFKFQPFDRLRTFFRFTRHFVKTEDTHRGCTRFSCILPATPANKRQWGHVPHVEVPSKSPLPPDAGGKLMRFYLMPRKTPFEVKFWPHDNDRRENPDAAIVAVPWDGLPVVDSSFSLGDAGKKRLKEEVDKTGVRPSLVIVLCPEKDLRAGGVPVPCAAEKPEFISLYMTIGERGNDPDGLLKVLVHELGHAAYNLGDEYSNSTCNKNPIEPANLNAISGKIKWQHLIDAGIVKSEPQVGGFGGCKDVYHPTPNCMMNENEPPFCPVCLERMAHATAEKATLVLDVEPPRYKFLYKAGESITFVAKTRANEGDPKCSPRYVDYWEVDGERCTGQQRSTGGGTEYTLTRTFGPGSHRIRFGIGDGMLFCEGRPTRDEGGARPAMPWDTKDWWIYVRGSSSGTGNVLQADRSWD